MRANIHFAYVLHARMDGKRINFALKNMNTKLSGKQGTGTRGGGGRWGSCPPCPLAGGAREAKVPFGL